MTTSPSQMPAAEGTGRRRRAHLSIVAVLCGVIFVLLSLYRFPGAGRDDVFVTLWSGETLGASSWFVNFNFEPEEMMTSILGALIVAVIHLATPGATYLLNKLVSLMAATLTLVVLWRGRRFLFDGEDLRIPALLALLATAFSAVFGYWALSGLESTQYALLLLLLVVALTAYAREPSSLRLCGLIAVQILLILVRAEGFWVVPVTAALLLLAPQRRWRSILAVLVPAAAFGLLLVLRYRATGLAWPNPVYAKTGSFGITIPKGFAYVGGYYIASGVSILQFIAMLFAVWLVARAGFALVTRRRIEEAPYPIVATAVLAVAYECFVILSGGNWMEYYRFLVPTLPLKNVLLAWLVYRAARSVHARGDVRRPGAVIAAVVACLGLAVQQQWTNAVTPISINNNCSYTLPLEQFHGSVAKMSKMLMWLNCAQRRDRLAIEPFIRKQMARYVPKEGRVTVVTYQGGYFPYKVRQYFGPEHLYFIGTQGLLNRDIAVLPVPKHSLGIAMGKHIDLILAGLEGVLSDAINPQGPILVYKLAATPLEQSRFEVLGFKQVWTKAGAFVFYRG